MERYYLILAITSACLSISMGGERNFSVRENGTSLELSTPWGTKSIVGDFQPSTSSNYHVEIPIQALKPSKKWKDQQEEEAGNGRNFNNGGPGGTFNFQTGGRGPASQDGSWEDEIIDEYEDDDDDDDDYEDEEDRKPASLTPMAAYDDTDKLILDANRLFNRRRYYEASAVVEEIIRKRPEHVRAWIMKGSLMKMQGHSDLAKNAWERALTLDPQNTELRGLIGGKP